MMTAPQKGVLQTIEQRFDHLLKVLTSIRFLRKEGLGNEVPFFIYPFPPEMAVEIQSMVDSLTKRLENEHSISVLRIDLYDLSIDLLKSRGLWDRILALESKNSKDQFIELLQGTLDAEAHLIPEIGRRMEAEKHDLILITGVGEVYPMIRSHTVLNNLQSTATEAPTVLFFPGEYSHSEGKGSNLNLFGRLPNDRYYRAFNLSHFQI
jgi:hypothetical protein